jgi:hypothetical protein
MRTFVVMMMCGAVLVACAEPEQDRGIEPAPMPIPDPVPAPEGAAESDDVALPDPAPEPDAEPERETIADDGRPEWWFPEVREEGGVIEFCVETLATGTLRDAGQRAVDVAMERAMLEARRRGYVFDRTAVSVPKTWGWPLRDLPGRDRRYAGYALVRLDLAELAESE